MSAAPDLRGMSYEECSRVAMGLLKQAVSTGRWFDLPDQLIKLRVQMEREAAP